MPRPHPLCDIRRSPVKHRYVICLLCLSLSPLAVAQDAGQLAAIASPWSGSGGELGFASASGNSTSETFNGKLRLRYAEGDWIHSMDLFALRSSAEYKRTQDDGSVDFFRQTTAYRYSAGAASGLQLGEHRQLTANARYERDDFATYDRQGSFSLGYGTRLLDAEKVILDAQLGPGVRRTHEAQTDETRTGLIGRGQLDLRYQITDNTALVNNLLVESGSYNTFAQNDLGLSVSMNDRLALKAGWQARHNSDVADGKHKTDTLTTVNLVYTYK